MNKNKGFMGIGILIAIVAILAVGGVAYYVGTKNSSTPKNTQENNNQLPINQNSSNSYEVPTGPFIDSNNYVAPTPITTACTSTSTPSIKVLSPNGGETYTAGQKITVKWSSCNVPPSDSDIFVALHQNGDWQNVSYLTNGTINDGSEIFTIPSDVSVGSYKIRVGSPAGKIQQDYSDNLFTINSATISVSQKCVDTATSLLPAYILTQGDYLDFKLSKVNLFALRSNTSDAQYFTGNPTNDACMVNVVYSVKLKAGAMNAGNGQESSDGWIINKSGYATIDKNSNGYYVVSMGTGY
ncbi:MAG TPA: Ser-Thr-rich GPI-anchored membrane family protein [Candidatus Paceibacterota bacterium]|jgi:hypothetical protein|nr:Ser-Thr-rich GPI-anchored membrane family protein [Candidatus Paceibacterota bacterium]